MESILMVELFASNKLAKAAMNPEVEEAVKNVLTVKEAAITVVSAEVVSAITIAVAVSGISQENVKNAKKARAAGNRAVLSF